MRRTGPWELQVFNPNFNGGQLSSIWSEDDRAVHDDIGLRYCHETSGRSREDVFFRLQDMWRGSAFPRDRAHLP